MSHHCWCRFTGRHGNSAIAEKRGSEESQTVTSEMSKLENFIRNIIGSAEKTKVEVLASPRTWFKISDLEIDGSEILLRKDVANRSARSQFGIWSSDQSFQRYHHLKGGLCAAIFGTHESAPPYQSRISRL